MKQIFPKEIIDSTVEVHQFKHYTNSKILYAVILVSIIEALFLLPFIRADVYRTASGIIKPNKDRLSVTSINSGKVVALNIKNNAFKPKPKIMSVSTCRRP